jgi:hypothetical protein
MIFSFLPEAGHALAFDQWGGFLHQVGASGVIIVVPQVGQSRQRSRWYGILFFEDPLVVGWILFFLTLIEQANPQQPKKEKKMKNFTGWFRDETKGSRGNEKRREGEKGYLTVSGADRSCCVLLL